MISLRLHKEFRNANAPFALNAEFSFLEDCGSAVLFGPSGSGKTLTMQCIAGLMRPDDGFIRIGTQTVFDSAGHVAVPAQKRRIGYMFQDYALFPHMTVLQNVAFPHGGLFSRMVSRREKECAMSVLRRFGIDHLASHYPSEISGGQKQRAALARCCNADPQLLLLDEPFSALDPLMRERLRHEMQELLSSMDVPALIITHDPEDADFFAQGLVFYHSGSTHQVGSYASVRRDFPSAAACLRHLQGAWLHAPHG